MKSDCLEIHYELHSFNPPKTYHKMLFKLPCMFSFLKTVFLSTFPNRLYLAFPARTKGLQLVLVESERLRTRGLISPVMSG